VSLTLDLDPGVHYCPSGGNLPTNFGISGTFCSLLIGQHLSNKPRDLATLTFNLRGHCNLEVIALMGDTGLHALSVYHAVLELQFGRYDTLSVS